MNAALVEKELDVQDIAHEKCEYISHEEVAEATRYFLEKHREAFIALANAQAAC